NEDLISSALTDIGVEVPAAVTPQSIRDLFRGKHREGEIQVAAGAAAARKGEFAEALAGHLRDSRESTGGNVYVPTPIKNVFDFLYPEPEPSLVSEEDGAHL